tara:strand:+ start:725 stop:922 length:198 start_codon:yes stop_codon:yes gene_type:complete
MKAIIVGLPIALLRISLFESIKFKRYLQNNTNITGCKEIGLLNLNYCANFGYLLQECLDIVQVFI